MTRNTLFISTAAFALLAWGGSAGAQTVGPDEAVQPDGAMSATLSLTSAQERAIYNAVIGQSVRPAPAEVPSTIGAVVPQATELGELPDPASADAPGVATLKYAMVEGNVIVIDPIGMQVVDVIHANAKP
jgi:hypothetical protein